MDMIRQFFVIDDCHIRSATGFLVGVRNCTYEVFIFHYILYLSTTHTTTRRPSSMSSPRDKYLHFALSSQDSNIKLTPFHPYE